MANALLWDQHASVTGVFFLMVCLGGAAGFQQARHMQTAATCKLPPHANCRHMQTAPHANCRLTAWSNCMVELHGAWHVPGHVAAVQPPGNLPATSRQPPGNLPATSCGNLLWQPPGNLLWQPPGRRRWPTRRLLRTKTPPSVGWSLAVLAPSPSSEVISMARDWRAIRLDASMGALGCMLGCMLS